MAALNIRTSLRYVAIYYIIVLSGSLPSPHYLRMLLGYVILLALIQSSINAVQHIMGDEFRDKYFGGPDIELELSSIHTLITDKLDKMGAAYGTFGKAAPAAFFMMIVIIYAAINAVRTNKILESYKWWLIYISLLVGIFLTYKRAAFIIALLVPLITAYILKRTQFVVRYIIFSAAGASLFFIFGSLEQNEYVREKSTAISPYESIHNLMTEEYWSIAFTKSRGWMLTEVSREVMASFKPLGYGADEMNAKAQLATLGGEFAKLLSFGAFDDVFIVACLVYYGPVGLILLLLAFYDLRLRAVRLYKHSDLEYKQIALMIMIAILILLPAAFVERILEFRALSFLLWSLCGYVAVAERHRLR
ncbi:MAG: hypothetical protein NZM04_08745 [Methylacidiphilales bacterium]|nr:hypothetical protein [Candidatus Methylacidiphilales bacterium]